MLYITMMTGCEEKKTHSSRSNETGEHIDTDNEYMYYYSVEFIK
mgnify:CR=1 FL=1